MGKLQGLLLIIATLAAAQAPPPEQGIAGKTAGEVFKNVKIMKDDPSTGLQGAMLFMSQALGVECRFCHSNQFDQDDKTPKQTARKMIQMTRDLNKNSFDGRLQITCYTCHQGHPNVVGVPRLPPLAATPAVTRLESGATGPTPEELFVKYEKALGGVDKIAAVHSRVLKGKVTGFSPQVLPAEFRQAAGKISVEMGPPERKFTGAFYGQEAWMQLQFGARKLNTITDEVRAVLEREAELYPAARLRAAASGMRLLGSAQVNGRETWVLGMAQRTPAREQLFFDKDSALLLRQTYLVPTILGPISGEIDYEDYRDSGGVKIPFQIKIERAPWTRITFEFTASEPNAAVPESAFEPPKP